MFNCTLPEYDTLYGPWLTNADALLDRAGYKPTERLLDLCGGTGAVSKAAIQRATDHLPRVTLVDLNPRSGLPQVKEIRSRAEDMARHMIWGHQDLVVCRQALGYLNLRATFEQVHRVLAPGGRFVFNTFQRPSRTRLKFYCYEQDHFGEAHLFAFGRVIHLQAKLTGPGKGIDLSVFRYHSIADICLAMNPYFSPQITHSGRSVHWYCVRNEVQ